mgnify:CR=1 FL=1
MTVDHHHVWLLVLLALLALAFGLTVHFGTVHVLPVPPAPPAPRPFLPGGWPW